MMDAPDIQSLESLTPPAIVSQVKGGQVRYDALRETAISLGTRGGLNKRTEEISQRLDGLAVNMDKIYDFRSLLISAPAGLSKTTQYYVLPPVISEGVNELKAVDDNEIQAADKIYRIESQAKFVTAPPTWRQYLEMQTTPIETPDPALLPKDDEERKAWKAWIAQGWATGVMQAEAIFNVNLNRLSRDYSGMIRYRVLLKQKLVSAPYLAESRLGVTGGGNEMAIDSRVLRITSVPSLNNNTQEWNPIVYPVETQQRQPLDLRNLR